MVLGKKVAVLMPPYKAAKTLQKTYGQKEEQVRRLPAVIREVGQDPALAKSVGRDQLDEQARKSLEALGYL